MPTLTIQIIAKASSGASGTTRYSRDLHRMLGAHGIAARLSVPTPMPRSYAARRVLRQAGVDLGAFFGSYPLHAPLPAEPATCYHLTSQTLATLLLCQSLPRPVVVSVLDIIPYLVRHHPTLNTLRHPLDRLCYRLALRGLHRADLLIAISHDTRRTLIEQLHLDPQRIRVVYPAVDGQHFRPQPVPAAFYQRYALTPDTTYLLYVGSDDPRKNLPTLLHAFAQVQQQQPATCLLLVGAAQFPGARARLQALAQSLGIAAQVRWLDHVPDADLPMMYNASTVLVLPALYEGFGYPLVEAMACGVPVVAANATALPEVVGDAGILFDPARADTLADALVQVVRDPVQAQRMREAGLERARQFAPAYITPQLVQVYTEAQGYGVR